MSATEAMTRFSTESPQAAAAIEIAIARFAAHKPGIGEALADALRADPLCLGAIALDGFMQILLARGETLMAAQQRQTELVAAQIHIKPTSAECTMIEALNFAIAGRLKKAADRLECHLENDPRDFVTLKLAHALRFMGGDEPGMLASTSRVLPAWTQQTPMYGYMLGCHAFGLGEAGRLEEAEAMGRRAVEIAPDDAWGLHAVSHVHETLGLTKQGIIWLDENRAVWSHCNNFAGHMAWHLALFLMKRGKFAEALEIYDAEIRPTPTDDFRDIANANSILWRMDQNGVSVGSRWEELHAIAVRRADDMTLVFASLHHLLSCIACNDRLGANRIAANLERLAQSNVCDQAVAAARVGAPLAHILRTRENSPGAQFDFGAIARALPAIGGSQAQRDVFLRTLAMLAARNGDEAGVTEVLKIRHAQRKPDCFTHKSASILAVRLEPYNRNVA